jgi:hypothetical protein
MIMCLHRLVIDDDFCNQDEETALPKLFYSKVDTVCWDGHCVDCFGTAAS